MVIVSGSTTTKNSPNDETAKEKTGHLRILATTDIHMHLIGHDYISDRPTANKGLASIATLIDEARTEAINHNRACILLDNGDMLQGTVMGDVLSTQPVTDKHPVAASVNAMRYDAIGIGNHDLDYGLPYLFDFADQLKMPAISTNLDTKKRDSLHRAAILACSLPTNVGGDVETLHIGILSALPAKTAIWNRHVLENQAKVMPAPASIQQAAIDLRKQGADLIVVLAHMGIGYDDAEKEESALSLAQIPGIDAIITGHTHQRFPGIDHVDREGVDADIGTLAQRPAIMPGHAGSDLAVLDLTLRKSRARKWRVIGHVCKLRSNTSQTEANPEIAAICAPAHHALRRRLSEEIGHINRAVHNYFSLAMPTDIAALTAQAKATVVREALLGSSDSNLPVLASVAAHTAGGRGGVDHFLSIPKGPVLRRHIAGLTPYANQIWAVRITGADLSAILEHSASIFNRLVPSQPDQLLLNEKIPSFNFDTVFGVSYGIDPTRPIGSRISGLAYNRKLVQPQDLFILATNQFRAAGGGGFASIPSESVVLRSTISPESALIDVMAQLENTDWPSQTPWSFRCPTSVQAVLHTSPNALTCLEDAQHLSPEPCGTSTEGFAKLRLTL